MPILVINDISRPIVQDHDGSLSKPHPNPHSARTSFCALLYDTNAKNSMSPQIASRTCLKMRTSTGDALLTMTICSSISNLQGWNYELNLTNENLRSTNVEVMPNI